jgi:hypothetical protein
MYNAELARRRRQHARRQSHHGRAAPEYAPGPEAEAMSGVDDAWKDQVIIVVGLIVRIFSVSSSFARSITSHNPHLNT